VFVQPIDYFLAVWFVLAGLSTAYVAWDQFRNNPEPVVMKWGFILVTLYMGPLGLLIYVLADKEPRPGEHEAFTKPLWKQGVGSTIHCVAGDATGIILAAAITAALGLPMWIDLIVEYVAGFAFGLFIFQSLFMKSTMGGTYWENVRKSFMPEFISMNFMMAGMAPVMSLLMMGSDMRAMEPTELLFWGVMSFGVIVGFITAYPANVWMVARGLKHGLMTEREPEFGKAEEGRREHAHGSVEAVVAGHRHAHARLDEYANPGHGSPGGNPGAGHYYGSGHGSSHGNGGGASRGPHGDRGMESDATVPQLAAFGGVSALALALGMIAPANWVNLTLSARDVGGAIMPPGMIMDRDTPAAAMLDMAAVHPRLVTASHGLEVRGDRKLQARMENGVKVFDLETSVIRWAILPDVKVDAYAINGQVPGPRLHIRQGDRVRINVTNRLPESTTLHWHGLILPNEMDGPAEITQEPIPPGGSYRYEFTAGQSGTYFYHSHDHVDRQQALGLYGALIIDPANPQDEIAADHDYVIQLQEWLMREGLTFPSMPMDGGQPNYFTINGRAYPSTDTIRMKAGETLKVRFIGTNNGFIHPMHIHGGPFEVVARDGETIPESARFLADTVNVGPGQRYDVVWQARRPGKWLIHCHIGHHTTNNNVEEKGGGGLMVVIDVQP
jgi:FtsP/CotA-like multicopper oxidase with cupredoxin domain